jgi:hypothetical protein
MEFKPPSYQDLRTWAFAKNPFLCTDCGCKLDFKNAQFRLKNVMLQASVMNIALCGNCLGKRITKWFKTPLTKLAKKHSLYDHKCNAECENCDKKVRRLARIIYEPWCDVRFGMNSWNGSYLCCDCLVNCATIGKGQCGYMAYIAGKRYGINEAGARIIIEEPA